MKCLLTSNYSCFRVLPKFACAHSSPARQRFSHFRSGSARLMSSAAPGNNLEPSTNATEGQQLNFPGLKELVKDVVTIYTTGSTPDMLRTLRSRYSPEVSFVDPLIVAHPRSSMELQFLALHKLFPVIEVEAGEAEVMAAVGEGDKSGLVQVSIPNTQRYFFSKKTHDKEGGGEEGGRQVAIEGTTLLTVDPLTGTVIKHEDVWHKPSPLRLPVFVRRFNTGCMNAVFRIIGWGREIQRAGEAEGPGSKTE